MSGITKKNHLLKNLNDMRKLCKNDFDFFPESFILPYDYNEIKTFLKKSQKTLILKPEGSCQGRGIFLIRDPEDIPMDKYVVQQYIDNPYTIESLKFDFRIYVLISGVNPLRIFLYKEGLARFATEPYEIPTQDNLDFSCMHLTNYAINKHHEDFVFNKDEDGDDVGHKRSLTATLQQLAALGVDTEELMNQIKQIIVKTILMIEPELNHAYKYSQCKDATNSMAFQILGFDILIDQDAKPWLLEVNASPSLATDTPLDEGIKCDLIYDTLTLVGVKKRPPIKFKPRQRNKDRFSITFEQIKEEQMRELLREIVRKDKHEDKRKGGYIRLYPDPLNTAVYERIQAGAQIVSRNRVLGNRKEIIQFKREQTASFGPETPAKKSRSKPPASPKIRTPAITTSNNQKPPKSKRPGSSVKPTKRITTLIKQSNSSKSHASSRSDLRSPKVVERPQTGRYLKPTMIQFQNPRYQSLRPSVDTNSQYFCYILARRKPSLVIKNLELE